MTGMMERMFAEVAKALFEKSILIETVFRAACTFGFTEGQAGVQAAELVAKQLRDQLQALLATEAENKRLCDIVNSQTADYGKYRDENLRLISQVSGLTTSMALQEKKLTTVTGDRDAFRARYLETDELRKKVDALLAELEKKVEAAEAAGKNLQDKETVFTLASSRFREQATRLQTEVTMVEATNRAQDRRLAELTAECDALKAAAVKTDQWKQQADASGDEVRALQVEKAALEKEKTAFENEKTALENEKATHAASNATLEKMLDDVRVSAGQLISEKTRWQLHAQALETSFARERAAADGAAQTATDSAAKELADLKATLKTRDAELSSTQMAEDKSTKALADLRATLEKRDDELFDTQSVVSVAQAEAAEAQSKAAAVKTQLTGFKVKLASVERDYATAQATIKQLKQQLLTTAVRTSQAAPLVSPTATSRKVDPPAANTPPSKAPETVSVPSGSRQKRPAPSTAANPLVKRLKESSAPTPSRPSTPITPGAPATTTTTPVFRRSTPALKTPASAFKTPLSTPRSNQRTTESPGSVAVTDDEVEKLVRNPDQMPKRLYPKRLYPEGKCRACDQLSVHFPMPADPEERVAHYLSTHAEKCRRLIAAARKRRRESAKHQ